MHPADNQSSDIAHELGGSLLEGLVLVNTHQHGVASMLPLFLPYCDSLEYPPKETAPRPKPRGRVMNALVVALLIGALGGLAMRLKKWREEKEARHPPAENSDHKC